jgi:hypothetical protein
MNKKQTVIVLFLIFFLFLVSGLVFFFVTSSKKVGDNRSKAASEVVAFLSPSIQNVPVVSGSRVPVVLKIKNLTGQRIDNMKVVSVYLKFSPSKANIFSLVDSDIVCDPSLPAQMPSSITDTTVYLTCANVGVAFGLNSQEEKTIATLTFTELANVIPGTNFAIDFDSSISPNVIIPDQSLNNLGGPGVGTSIVIGDVVSPSVTQGQPTSILTQVPTLTNTPQPSLTSVPTNTPAPTATATQAPVATPTSLPNTFSKDVMIWLKGVDATSDPAILDYRNGAGKVTAQVWILPKDGQGNTYYGVADATYDSAYGKYRLHLINIPNKFITGHIMLVKPPKHLRAKFCFNGETLRCTANMQLATQGIDFNVGGPYVGDPVDLGNYPILPGDVNVYQDGVLNGQDVLLMLTELAKSPPQRDLEMDLNYDMVVNGIDYGLMLNSMVVYDDE